MRDKIGPIIEEQDYTLKKVIRISYHVQAEAKGGPLGLNFESI